MTTDPIRILYGSDFHFGMRNASQEEMADAFASTIFPLLPETDIFCLNGDFFDRPIDFDSHTFDPIYEVILRIFAYCEKYQITLRVLLGTWDHDKNQCKRFEAFYRQSGSTFNFRYIDQIEVETITVRGRDLRFFHVPDDMPYETSDEIVAVLRLKLHELGWDYVDYGCMHGFFDFTFPERVAQGTTLVFKNTQFDFVKKVIDVGHVHQHRICEGSDDGLYPTVISNGSFDRGVFGDEDPKGCIRVTDHGETYTAQFIENTKAAVFDTLLVQPDLDTNGIRDLIDSYMRSLTSTRKLSLRFVVDAKEQHEAIRTYMRETYPDVRIERKKSSDKLSTDPMLPTSNLITVRERRLAPTRKTIASFIKDLLPDNCPLTLERIETHLEPSG